MKVLHDLHSHRGQLVPVLGAGVSVPLGLPTWSQLVESLQEWAFEISGTTVEMEGLSLEAGLTAIRKQIGNAQYVNIIRRLLKVPQRTTTRTLTALAMANVQKTITFNLDRGYEQACEMAGLELQAVFTGESSDKLVSFLDSKRRCLLKLHGCVEDSTTWVLDSKDYEKAYSVGQNRNLFLANRNLTPLFIGFGLKDESVLKSIETYSDFGSGQSYAFLPESSRGNEMMSRLAAAGISPIYIKDYTDIPEYIHQIFDNEKIALTTLDNDEGIPVSKYGCVEFEPAGAVEPDDARRDSRTIMNALDTAPSTHLFRRGGSRDSGPKKQFISDIVTLASNPESERLNAVLSALWQSPDVIFSVLLPAILADGKVTDVFRFLAALRKNCDVDSLQALLTNYLLGVLDRPFPYAVRKGIARHLAFHEDHPALWFARGKAALVRVGDLETFKYPMTRRQINTLMGAGVNGTDPDYADRSPITAYVIANLSELDSILLQLNREYAYVSDMEKMALTHSAGMASPGSMRSDQVAVGQR
jgi:hypothetical protein